VRGAGKASSREGGSVIPQNGYQWAALAIVVVAGVALATLFYLDIVRRY
jgi:hypothetical protein